MARKKASKDRNVDNNDNEDETEEPSSNKRKTRSSPGRSASRKAMAKLKEESTEEEEEQDDDDSGKDDESKEQDTSAKDDEDEDDDENNYEEDEKDEEDEKPKKKQKTGKDKPFNCPHCPKGFTSKGGLDYHLGKFQKFLIPGGSNAVCFLTIALPLFKSHFSKLCLSIGSMYRPWDYSKGHPEETAPGQIQAIQHGHQEDL